MDWLPWLTPLLLAALSYPLLVSGCALDTTGLLDASDRLLQLNFPDLPKLGAVPVTHVVVEFEIAKGQETSKVPQTPASTDVSAKQFGPIAVTVPAAEQTSVTCTCRVWLQRTEGWQTLPTIGPIAESVTTAHKTIAFTLSYVGWPGEPDYNPNGFKLAPDVLGTA